MPVLKTFAMDRLLRNEQGLAAGRVVLAKDYEPDHDIAIAVLEVFKGIPATVKNSIFYVDGIKYKVPADLPDVKITVSRGKLLLNNFYLVKVD